MPLSHYVLSDAQWSGRVLSVNVALIILGEWVTMETDTAWAIRFLDFDEANPVGQSALSSVLTVPGETQVLMVTGAGIPPAGALIQFGLLAQDSLQALVRDVEPGRDFTARLTMTNAALEIDTLADAYTPETRDPWVRSSTQVSILSGRCSARSRPGPPKTLMRSTSTLRPPSALIAGFELDHRLYAAPSWTTVTLTGGRPTAELSYDVEDVVELRARAIDFGAGASTDCLSATWTAGSWWGVTATHTPGSANTLSQTLTVEVRACRVKVGPTSTFGVPPGPIRTPPTTRQPPRCWTARAPTGSGPMARCRSPTRWRAR